MFRFLPYVLKNLRGHRVRTVMTIGGAAVLMLLFCFVSSIQEGLRELVSPSRQDERLIVFQSYRFCPSVSQLPYPAYEEVIRKVPGVADCLPIKVIVNNCRASLDTVVFHGVPPESLRRVRKLNVEEGSWAAFEARKDGGALVGRKLAERRGIRVGQPFSVAGVTVNVEGIFSSDRPVEENLIYVHLNALLSQMPGHHQDLNVTAYEVHVSDPSQSEAVARRVDEAIKDRFPITTDTKPEKAFARQALADLVEIIGFTRWLGYLCVGVVGVLVANAVLMAAQDRIKEHAVLQTIGYSGWRIFRLIMTESLLVSTVGGLLGAVGATLWLWYFPMTLSNEGVNVDFVLSPLVAAQGLGLAMVMGVLAGVAPAWQAAWKDIPQALRA